MLLAQQTPGFICESLNCGQRSDFHLRGILPSSIKGHEARAELLVLTQELSLLSNFSRIQIWWPLDTM